MALAVTLMIFVVAHSFKGFRPLFLLRLLRRLRARSMALPMAIGLAFAVPAVLLGQSGTAFRDFNGNGIQNGAEPGVEGVIVRLYANASSPTTDQFIGETVTGANGTYNFAISVTSGRAANIGENVRIEFTIPSSFECSLSDIADFPGGGGNAYGSSVQFITGRPSGINFGINYPGQWAPDPNPLVMLPCYAFGNPNLPGSTATNAPAFVSFNFTTSGVPQPFDGGQAGVPPPNMLATIGEVGSLYGVAFSKQAQKVFTSAVLRRHAALGPLGSGGIYLVDPFSAAADKTTDFLNLDAIGIATQNAGGSYPPPSGNNTSPVSGYIGTNAERGLPAAVDAPSTDYAAGDQIGKVSIGDIDISDDGRYLYVVNLYDRKIYEIDLVDPANPQAPTLANVATRVRSWDVPNPATMANQGEHRPWGLKFYRGKLYVGIVLSGQNAAGNVVSPVTGVGNAQIGTALRGYVYEFDVNAQAFVVRLDFSFDYGRERPWIPWGYSPGRPSRYFSGEDREWAEPIISDIEFDDTGNMLIGVLDRKGHQYAINNNDYNGNIVLYEYATAGELLRANVAQVGNNCVYNIVTRPGTTDYYDDNGAHPESVQGPLAVLPGENEVVAVWLDPIGIRAGGVIRHNNVTGGKVTGSAYEVFEDRATLGNNGIATPSKANGLGDVELSGEAASIEIGNLVWSDADRDGVQDGGEVGVPNVTIQLFADFDGNDIADGPALATTMTSSIGTWYFSHTNVTDGDPATPGNQAGPQPNRRYLVRVGAADWSGGVGIGALTNYLFNIPANVVGSGTPDLSDNDATLMGGVPQITVITGVSGQNDHSFDMAFFFCPTITNPSPAQAICEGGSGANITVQTNQNVANSIRFVLFTTDQMAGGSPSMAEAAAIYGGGVVLATVTPTGGADPYTATLTTAAGAWNTRPPGTYYVYAILNPDVGDFCRPIQEIVVTITAQAEAGTGNTQEVCFTATSDIDLASLIVGADPGGIWTAGGGNPAGGTFNAGAGTFNPAGASLGTYTFQYAFAAVGGCVADQTTVTVIITNAPDVCPTDFGDLPNPPYPTTLANTGASHIIVPGLKIGASVDAEGDGQPSANADGDGADEDGFNPALPANMLVADRTTTITVPVMNMTGGDAKLTVYIDFNNDGDLTDANEMFFTTIPNNAVAGTLNVAVPADAILNTDIGMRFRLTTEMAMSPTGLATSGEVEDYIVQVMGFDYGDLADSGAGTGTGNYETQDANNGASHKIIPGLKIGASVDAEGDGQQSVGANGDGADENGFNPALPANMLVADRTTTIIVPVMNMTGGDAKLTIYIDFNNDGDLTDAGEMFFTTVANNATSASLSVAVPANAVLNTDLGTRIRLTTDLVMSPNGPAPDGEVEDYLVQVMGFDYGDLADTGAGTGAGNYQTQDANGGASHKISTNAAGMVTLKIGASIDAEGDGQQSADASGDGADEDGFNPALPANMLVADRTTTITIPVMNMTGGDAKLTIYIDFDNDGDLTDAGEMFSTTVANNATSATLSIAVPANSVLNTDLGTRIRLTTDLAMSPNGPAPDGEVEDYLVQVMGFDYGDLADTGAGTSTGNYNTAAADNGPSHKIVPGLKLGSSVDAEGDALPGATANGDDANDSDPGAGTDDENGVTFPMLVTGTPVNVDFTLMNMTGGDAKLTLFIDWNKDGDFLDAGEMYSTTVANNAATASIPLTPPMDAVLNMDLGVRVRLSTDANASMSPVGPAPDGEVEDYVVQVMGYDYGDLADGSAGTGTAPVGVAANHNTLLSDNGPRHKLVTDANGNVTLKIGASVDDDVDGQPSADAGETTGGDDATESPDDEELDAYLAPILFILTQTTNLTIPVMNMTGADAKLTLFFDFNKDGDFSDAGEMFSTTVANNATVANLAVTVPANAVVGQDLGFRIRLASDPAESMSPVGEAQSGEVEDYMVQVVGFDYGDHPGTYGTTDPDGPRHIVNENLKLGSSVDVELDGIPSSMSGAMPGTGGDDNDPGLVTFGNSSPAGDDENGIALVTPMIPGTQACFQVNAMNMTGSAAVLQAWVDWDGDGSFGAGEQLNTGSFAPSGAVVPNGGLTNAQLCFDVPANAVFAQGNAFVRFRLSPLGGLSANSQTAPVPFGEIEDYKFTLSKVGNYVWEDIDGNGQQNEAGSAGLNGVTVQLVYYGLDGVAGGTGANADITYTAVTATNGATNGYYYFCGLIAGDYELSIPTLPTDFVPTAPNIGSDVTDSENPAGTPFTIVDPAGQPTGENGTGDTPNIAGGFPDNQNNQTLDFGLLVLAELGNYTWIDFDSDGEQDPADIPLGGATIMLTGTDNLGNPVSLTTTTAPDGSYLFDDLWPGTYMLMFDFSTLTSPPQLLGFAQYLQFTLLNQGADVIDSDANATTGKTGNYVLVSQSSNMTVDAGAIVPCLPPTNLSANMIMLTTATLTWQVNNDPFTGIDVTNHCWRVTIGGQGYNGNPGQAIQEMTVCAGEPGVTIIGNMVSIDVSGLAPGTCYQFTVSETCDGIGPEYNASAVTLSAPFCTYDDPPVGSATAVAPSCPLASPGFVADGSITVTVAHGTSCQTGIYNIEVVSGPYLPLNPTTYVGVGAGSYVFADAGPGSYTFRITEVSGTCNQKPSLHPVLVTVVVPNAVDVTPPTKFVRDVLGNDVTALGPYTLPEGDCGVQVQLYVSGMDSCDGPITAAGAVTATAVMNPASVQPGTQVNVTTDGFGTYLVNAHFATGTTTLTIGIADVSGNVTTMTYVVTVADNIDPVVTLVGSSQFVIPACETETTGIVTIQVDDECDQTVNMNNLVVSFGGATGVLNFTGNNYQEYLMTFPGPGNYLISASYTDAAGNVGFIDQVITVVEAAANQPPTIYANAETVTLSACEEEVCFVYSFIIEDDCEPIDPSQVIFNGGGSGMPNLNGTGFFYTEVVGPNTMYFEVSGCVEPGVYFPLITYQGQTANPTITAIQNGNEPASIVMPGNLTYTIPQCGTLEVTMSATIVDDCDNPINPAQASFTLCGQPIAPSYVNAAAGYFEFVVPLTSAEDGCLLAAQYTDGSGAVSTVDALIRVVSQPDNWAPVIIYPAQTIAVELDDCNNQQQEVCFEVTATDNCSGDVIPQVRVNGQLLTPQAGTNRYCYLVTAGGQYNVVITAADAAGNVRTEDFVITAVEIQTPPVNLSCLGQVNATLGADCSVLITPLMVLNGTYGCLTDDDFEIIVQDGNTANGAVADGCGEFVYEVRLRPGVNGGTFTTCWGTVLVEDKTAPVIDCPDDTNQALTSLNPNIITGSLGAPDPSFDYTIYPCYLEFVSQATLPGNRFYDVFTFSVTQTDVYTFDIQSNLPGGLAPGGNAMAALFSGVYNPAEPCSNIIAQNDQVLGAGGSIFVPNLIGVGTINFSPTMRVTLPLVAGQTYSLLTTSTLPGATGNYTWLIYGDQPGSQLVGQATTPATERRTLICDDIDRVRLNGNVPTMDENGNLITVPNTWCYRTDRNGNVILPSNPTRRARIQQLIAHLQLTGLAANGDTFGGGVSDNCGNIKVCVTEVVNETTTCVASTIQRTFTAFDRLDSSCTGAPLTAACTQTITFRKPTIADVQYPPFTAYLECDENFTTDANGNPSGAHTGYPFLRTAFGYVDINQTVCNLGATYTDAPRIEDEACASSYKVFREWRILDWCNPGNSRVWSQVIKVGDFTAPELSAPTADYDWDGVNDVLTFSTNAFSCNSFFALPAPNAVSDNCSDYAVTIEVVVNGVVVAVGIPGQVVGPIAEGGQLCYTAADACGNSAEVCVPFRITDQVAPTAKCDDELHISINGSVNQNSLNVSAMARVLAADIDEGSDDNCGEVRLEVRRRVDAGVDYACLDAFDYNGDGAVINDEVRLSTQAGAPDGEPGQSFYFTPWLEYIDATCCDVAGTIRIELRVWDDANDNGLYGRWYGNADANDDGLADVDLSDNSNVCWLDVLVEDKLNPLCTAPHNVTLECNDLPTGFPGDLPAAWSADQAGTRALLNDLFGAASGADNCEVQAVNELAPIDQRDDCGFGTIIRRFQVVDGQGLVSLNNCRQLITINEVHNYEIKFPRDAAADCSDPNIPTIETNVIGCDLLAISGANGENDEIFEAEGDECYKIKRTYRVINWCQWDGETDPVVVRRDEDCDNLGGDEDIWVLVRPNNVVYLDRDNNENNTNPLLGTNRCQPNPALPRPNGHWANSNTNPELAPLAFGNPQLRSFGYYEYSQFIKVYDTSDPAIEVAPYEDFCSYNNAGCDGVATINFRVTDDCGLRGLTTRAFLDAFVVDANNDGIVTVAEFQSDANLTGTLIDNGDGNFTLTGTFPIGRHAFLLNANDGCYNDNPGVVVVFEVTDCKVSAPVCIAGLTATLMPVDANNDGTIDGGMTPEIWASEFVASLADDCTGPLKIAVYDRELGAGVAPNPNTANGIQFDCNDFAANGGTADQPATITIFVYSIDGAGNYDYCETFLLLQDPNGLCAPSGNIAGFIRTEEDEAVQGVEVALSGMRSAAMTTGADGAYAFTGLAAGGDYTVTPTLDANPINGVSTFDIVLINKHILQSQLLDSPYKMIAADANRSGSITTLDLIQIRRLILNITTNFPNNTSWRFVDADFDFPVPTNPWATSFPEVINFNNFAGVSMDSDFVAVKVGDVNGSAAPNLLGSEERNLRGTFFLEVAEAELRAGNVYTVDVRAGELARIEGYQGTLQLEGAELVDIAYGRLREDHFGLRFAGQGAITTSWNGEAGNADEVLFSLVIRATRDALLSEVLSVSSRYTAAEAYRQTGEMMGLGFRFSGSQAAGNEVVLYQNVPNPFSDQTVIGFYLPTAGQTTLTIQDGLGRTLKVMQANLGAGYHQYKVTARELGATGVLHYTLKAGSFSASRKMILVE